MSLLEGRTAGVTGGARGIGYEVARRLVAEGPAVVLGDLDEAEAVEAARTRPGTALDDFRTVVDVHRYRAWLGTKPANLITRQQGRGSIVNISSISGKVGNGGQTDDCAAKAGMVGLTKAAAKEVAHAGLRVNAVQPGLTRTAITPAMPRKAWDSRRADLPMGRAGEPAEVTSVVLFLAGNLASYITCGVVGVNGGRHA